MSTQHVLNPGMNRWVRLSVLCLTPLTGLIFALITSRPAAADSNPCTDPALGAASIQSTLQLQVRGVDWPTFSSITRITIPYKWRGTIGLLGNKAEQSSSLRCFLPLGHEDYRPAPPQIILDPATYNAPANVKIIDTVTETEGPNSPQSWLAGLWSVNMKYRNFQVSFLPPKISKVAGHGSWTAIVDSPDLSIQDPSLRPNADDGHGKITWWFRPGKNQPSSFDMAFRDKWPVRMNLSMQRWPMRWISDALWAIGDGVLVYAITLWMAWRHWRLRRDNNEQRKLSLSVILISSLGIAYYLIYVIDDYLWYYNKSDVLWKRENLALLAVATILFTTGFGDRWRVGAWICYPVTIAGGFIARLLPWPSANLAELIALTVPLLLAMTFTAAGAALWISRMWPFGDKTKEGCLRKWEDTPFRSRRIITLVFVMLGASVLVLGQGTGGAYDDWVHRHWWGHGTGAFPWVAWNILQETHWWISDGLQWILYFVIATGTFAVLRAMSTSARGVFFSANTTRGDLAVLTMVFGGWFVGTWGFYDDISIPAPFMVAVIFLGGCALTRRLSRLDKDAAVTGVTDPPASHSLLVTYRNALLTAAEDASKTQTRKQVRRISAPAPPAGRQSGGELNPPRTVISLDPAPSASLLRRKQSYSPPELILQKAVDPGATALALGPAETWWDNGIAAVRAGALLTVVPVAFDVYTFWRTGELSPLAYATGLLDTLGIVAAQLVSWLAGLFTFGVLLPYLRGMRSPIKGTIFGAIVLAAATTDAAIRHIFGAAPYRTFLADGLIAIALFATLGLILDFRTLQVYHRGYGLIGTLYQISTVRIAVTYATTLLIVAIGVWQNVYLANQTAQERAQNTSNIAQYVNGQAGTGAPASGGH